MMSTYFRHSDVIVQLDTTRTILSLRPVRSKVEDEFSWNGVLGYCIPDHTQKFRFLVIKIVCHFCTLPPVTLEM